MVEPLAKKRKTEKRKWFAPDEVFLKVWGETIVPETNRRQQEVQDSLTHRKAVPVVEFDVGEDERDEEYTPEGERELLEDEAVLYAEWVANTLVAGHALLPVIQTADGEHANVAAWKNKRFGEQLQKANQRLLKFAAGASMSQQPMDLSYGFMTLRGAFKGERFKKALRRPAPVWLERALAATDTAGGMAASSRRCLELLRCRGSGMCACHIDCTAVVLGACCSLASRSASLSQPAPAQPASQPASRPGARRRRGPAASQLR